MRPRQILFPASLALMGICVGCESDEQMKRVEQEVGDLKVEVFKLRQQVEENNRKAEADRGATSESRDQERRFRADLQETLRQVQESTRLLSNRAGSVPKPGGGRTAEPTTPAPSEDDKAYAAAVLDYNRGSYALAADSLQLFLKSKPSSPRRPDALFYLGLAYYNQKKYDKAQAAFDQIIRDHAASNQFLPARLKRAQCLAKLGLNPAAIRAFKDLVEGFPGTAEARTAAQELADLGM